MVPGDCPTPCTLPSSGRRPDRRKAICGPGPNRPHASRPGSVTPKAVTSSQHRGLRLAGCSARRGSRPRQLRTRRILAGPCRVVERPAQDGLTMSGDASGRRSLTDRVKSHESPRPPDRGRRPTGLRSAPRSGGRPGPGSGQGARCAGPSRISQGASSAPASPQCSGPPPVTERAAVPPARRPPARRPAARRRAGSTAPAARRPALRPGVRPARPETGPPPSLRRPVG